MASRLTLNTEALYAAIDRKRRSQRMHFRDIAHQAGISASGLTRLGQGRRPDADCLIRMLAWLGTTDLAPFIDSTDQPEPARLMQLADLEAAAERAPVFELGQASTCIDCGDDLWPGEHVAVAKGGGGYRCMVCEVKRQRAEQPTSRQP